MSCTTSKKNLNKSKCSKLPTLPKLMITTGDDFKLAPADYATEAALQLALQNAIKAGIASRIWLWPAFSNVEDLSQEAQYLDTPLNLIPVRDGQYRYKLHISKNMDVHKAMKSHRALNEGRAFLFDLDNQLFGNEDAAGNVYGHKIAMLHTEKLKLSDGTNPTSSAVYLCLADNEEIDDAGVVLEAPIVNKLTPLTDLKITVAGAFAAASFKVDVKQKADGTPVSGLLLADFVLYNADKTITQVIQTVVEDANIPGRYTITSPGADLFEDGVLTLRAPSLLTVSAYEVPAEGELIVDIP